jgi:hypothetical protein
MTSASAGVRDRPERPFPSSVLSLVVLHLPLKSLISSCAYRRQELWSLSVAGSVEQVEKPGDECWASFLYSTEGS